MLKEYTKSKYLLILGISIVVGIAIGFAVFNLTIIENVIVFAGIPISLIIIKKPEAGIVIIAIITSSIIFEDAIPLISIAIGSFHIADLFLIVLLTSIGINTFIRKRIAIDKSTISKIFIVFYGTVAISACVAIFRYKVGFNPVMRQFRYLSYYLLFFVVVNLIRQNKQIIFLVRSFYLLACVTAMAMIVQAILGPAHPIMPGRVEEAATFDKSYEAARVLPPGQLLIMVVFIVSVCLMANRKAPLFKSALFYSTLLLGGGILLTYNRNNWISIIAALSIFFLLNSARKKMKLMAWVAGTMILAAVLVPVFNKNNRIKSYVDSISERVGSLFAIKKTSASSSLELRKIENEYAWKSIAGHPWLGIGLYNRYRPRHSLIDYGSEHDLTDYVHNGYLWILVNMGLLGFVPFIGFFVFFIWRGLSNWRKVSDADDKALVIGISLAGLGIMLGNFVNPMFMQWSSIVIIAAMIGIVEKIIQNETAKKSVPKITA